MKINEIEYYLEFLDSNKNECKSILKLIRENAPDSPGSSHNHQNWSGGYYDHVKEILSYADFLYHSFDGFKKLPFTFSDVILVLFLHDIEKPFKYSDWGRTQFNHGDSNYKIREDLISRFGINLSSDQENALKYIHGEGDDYKSNKRVMNELAAFCHCCDVISARIYYDHLKYITN